MVNTIGQLPRTRIDVMVLSCRGSLGYQTVQIVGVSTDVACFGNIGMSGEEWYTELLSSIGALIPDDRYIGRLWKFVVTDRSGKFGWHLVSYMVRSFYSIHYIVVVRLSSFMSLP